MLARIPLRLQGLGHQGLHHVERTRASFNNLAHHQTGRGRLQSVVIAVEGCLCQKVAGTLERHLQEGGGRRLDAHAVEGLESTLEGLSFHWKSKEEGH